MLEAHEGPVTFRCSSHMAQGVCWRVALHGSQDDDNAQRAGHHADPAPPDTGFWGWWALCGYQVGFRNCGNGLCECARLLRGCEDGLRDRGGVFSAGCLPWTVLAPAQTPRGVRSELGAWQTTAFIGEKRFVDEAVSVGVLAVSYQVRVRISTSESLWSLTAAASFGSQGSQGGPLARAA